MAVSGNYSSGWTDHEDCRLSEHHCRQIAPYTVSVFQMKKESSHKITLHVTGLKLCRSGSKEHNTEFQLKSCPPHSTHLNLVKNIWGGGGGGSWNDRSDLKNNYVRLSRIYMANVWISGTICLQQSTKDVWYPYQGGLKLFCMPNVNQHIIR